MRLQMPRKKAEFLAVLGSWAKENPSERIQTGWVILLGFKKVPQQ